MKTWTPTTVHSKTGMPTDAETGDCLHIGYASGEYVGVQHTDMADYPVNAKISALSEAAVYTVTATPFTIPRSFFGIHMPYLLADVGNTPDYGTLFLNAQYTWSTIETAKGVYATAVVNNLNAWLADAAAHGRDVIYRCRFTPTWASSTPASSDTLGLGAAYCPADFGDLTDHITYMCGLANAAGVENFHVDGWNEPNTPGIYKDSVANLVTHQTTIDAAVAAFNVANATSYKTISAGFTDSTGVTSGTYNLNGFLAAGGAANCDYVGYHNYSGGSVMGLIVDRALIGTVLANMTTNGVTKDLIISEVGHSRIADYENTNYLIRQMLFAAAKGVKRFCWYSWTEEGIPDMRLKQAANQWATAVSTLAEKTVEWVNANTKDHRIAASIDGVVMTF